MFRGIIMSVCFLFVAQGAQASVQQCTTDLNSGSRALIRAARTVDHQYKADGYSNFNFFTKMIKDGNRAGTNHMKAAERYVKRQDGTGMQNLKNLNRIHGAVATALPDASRAMKSCNRQSSCAGMKGAKHRTNLRIKCDQLNRVLDRFQTFANSKDPAYLTSAQKAVRAMRGTNRNEQMITAALKAESQSPSVASNEDGNTQISSPSEVVNGELNTGEVVSDPVAPARKTRRSRSTGSVEAVTSCQSRFSNSFKRFKYCGCRIHDSYNARKSCQRGVARQSKAELCENNNTIRRNFRSKCKKILFWN